MLHRAGRRRTRHEGGAAAVEFALIVPILLMLAFGTVQYSFYFWAKQGGADIARHAARISAVGNPASCGEFQSAVSAQITGFAAADDPPEAVVTRTYVKGPGNSGAGTEVGDIVTVTVQFNSLDMDIPLIPFIEDGRVSETAEARVDYVPTAPEACS